MTGQWEFIDDPLCPFYKLRHEPRKGVEVTAFLWLHGGCWAVSLQTVVRTTVLMSGDAFKPTSYELE